MRALHTAELLDCWDAGVSQPRWTWAHAMVCAAYPELDGAAVDALTVGERDARLLALREALFGTRLAGRSECPACHAAVELELSTADLRAMPGERSLAPEPVVPGGLDNPSFQTSPTSASGSTCAPTFRLLTEDCEIRFRVPTAGDLTAAAHEPDVATMRAFLLDRCVLGVDAADATIDLGKLPAATIERVIEGMSAADPRADLRLELNCPECTHRWLETFDIVAYLWAELDAWAQRLLHDVHLLASAYGWSEAQVLALSEKRRAHYLEMINT